MAPSRTLAGRRARTTSRRRLALAALASIPLLAACGSGFHAETNEIYQPGPGITVRDGGVYVVNALVVTDGDGNGTLVAALINQQAHPDRLIGVGLSGPGSAGKALDASIASGYLALASQRPVQLAATADVRVEGSLVAGAYYQLVLTFKNAAPVSTEIPIVTQTAEFADVTVGPTPPPSTPSHPKP